LCLKVKAKDKDERTRTRTSITEKATTVLIAFAIKCLICVYCLHTLGFFILAYMVQSKQLAARVIIIDLLTYLPYHHVTEISRPIKQTSRTL